MTHQFARLIDMPPPVAVRHYPVQWSDGELMTLREASLPWLNGPLTARSLRPYPTRRAAQIVLDG